MQKTKSSIYNAIISIFSTGISSILALISTRLILSNYGSDFNGVVATVTQVITVLLIIEGGYTLAINVSLFKPYIEKDNDVINSILSAANKIFIKIAYAVLVLGVIATIIYTFFIKSNLDYFTIFTIFLMVVFSTFFNLIYTTKYRIMIQVAQKEYKISAGALILNNMCSILVIFMTYFNINMLIVRFIIMLFTIFNGAYIYSIFKKDFKDQKYFKKYKPDFSKIIGTKDIMIQKITGAIYMSAPILFISTFISTTIASVYAVYNSIYSIAKVVLSTLVASPVNGFGQLIAERDKSSVYKKFLEYEYIIILSTVLLLGSIVIMINPFISIYTMGIQDVNYLNNGIAFMSVIIILLEQIHIPSGNIINLSSNFKIAKKIQMVTCVILIIALTIGGYIFGIYGILVATIIVNMILAYMEISYVHKKYFESSIFNFIKPFFSNVILASVLFFIWQNFIVEIKTYITFFIVGILVFCINLLIMLGFNIVFFRDKIKSLLMIIKTFLDKTKNVQ